MEKINKSIIVNVVVDYTVDGEVRKDLRASGYVEDGHEFYLVDEFMESDMRDLSPVFRADGTRVTAECKMTFIRKKPFIQPIFYNKRACNRQTGHFYTFGLKAHNIIKINW